MADDHATRRIVRTLYPRDKVPEEAVLPVLAALSLPHALPTKLLLLTWLRLVLDRIDGMRHLTAGYGVFFHFLDSDTLRYGWGPRMRSAAAGGTDRPRVPDGARRAPWPPGPPRPILCQILYKITRKQHVLGFRCRRLYVHVGCANARSESQHSP